MRERIRDALKEAVKSRDRLRISTLRLISAAIKDRDIAARGADRMNGVSDDEILDILTKMVKQRVESAQTYKQAGRDDLAQQETEEIAIIRDFLPRQLDEAEIRAAVAAAVEELQATGLKDMGKVMGWLKDKYAGQMDFARASVLVREQLGS